MIPLNLWEHQSAVKSLYSKCVGAVCQQYNISRMELDILLFLANNPCFDTATDVVEIRYLAKSQVSTSIKSLEKQGLLRREYTHGNRKTAHLKLCPAASDIIRDGRIAQEQFMDYLLKGFSAVEIETMKEFNDRILRNINAFWKGETIC